MSRPLANQVRARRGLLRQTQTKAAEEIGCSRATIVGIEGGRMPRADLLLALTRWLQVDGNQVLAWMEEQQAGEVSHA